MYCLGERRSDTFSPRAIRSRSRWRIFSRSSATDFMRLASESVASSGIAKRDHGRDRRHGGEHHRQHAGVCQVFGDQVDHGVALFALEIEVDHFAHDHDADDIHTAQPASIMRPIGWVQSSSM